MNNYPRRYDYGLAVQVNILTVYLSVRESASRRIEEWRDDERGEVTATTALIMLLVAAAVIAGGVIANKIKTNANRIPDP